MITTDKLNTIAQIIVDSMDITEDDYVLIGGGEHAHALLDRIRIAAMNAGANHCLHTLTDNYGKELFGPSAPLCAVEKTPLYFDYLKKKATVFIYCDWFADPGILAHAPAKKREAWSRAKKPIRDLLHHGMLLDGHPPIKNDIRWLYFFWPSKAFARFHNIDPHALEKTTVNGMTVPSETMVGTASMLEECLLNAKKIYIVDEKGTDFWISVKNRPVFKDMGKILPTERGMNLPAGEVYIPPVETKGEGVLFCPITNDKKSNQIIRNAEVPFTEGQIQIEKVSADDNLEYLLDAFRHCEQLDRNAGYREIRTKNVAEFGIGFNPHIKKAIGFQLLDEKITGSIHLAWGWNSTISGTSQSDMHWDMVTDPSATIKVEYLDGTKALIMEKGVIL